MSDALETVADGVCVVVKWVYAPAVAYVRVRVELYAVDDGISESSVRVFVVYLCAQ